MAVFQPTYRDPKTGEQKQSKVWWYNFVFKGKRYRKSALTKNKRTAEQIEAARKTQLAKGEVGIADRPKAPTLREFGPQFEAAIEARSGRKPETVKFYKEKYSFLLKHERLASARLDEIDESLIDDYVEWRTRQVSRRGRLISPASVNRELATLRRLLRLASKRKIIGTVPEVKLLDGEHEREFVLSFEQEDLYLATADSDLRDLAILMLDSGLRMKEALGLQWENVHLNPAAGSTLGYLKVTWQTSKADKSRNVPLTERVAEMLRGRKPQKTGYVFNRKGEMLYQTWVNQQHAALRRLLKFPEEFVPHTFRHTYGTRLGEAGTDAFTIMRLMGHSSVTVSQRYVHPTPETLERAVDRLQGLKRSKAEGGNEAGKVAKVSAKVTDVKKSRVV